MKTVKPPCDVPKRLQRIGKILEDALPNTKTIDGLWVSLVDHPAFGRLQKELKRLGLRRAGTGSSRVVYEINGRYVVKIATGKAGVAQNRAESKIFDGSNPVCNENVMVSPSYRWVIARKAMKVSNQKVKKAYGVSLSLFRRLTACALYPRDMAGTRCMEIYKEKFRNHEFFTGLTQLKRKLCAGDMDEINSRQFGFVDGKLVLIDGGLTDSIYYRWYH